MEAVSFFSLIPTGKTDWRHHAERVLVFNGKSTSITLYGDEIAHQFVLKKTYLVITSYDYFEATSYWYYLLDSELRLRDTAYTPDYFGFMERLVHESEARISFGFHGTDDRWAVSFTEPGSAPKPRGLLQRWRKSSVQPKYLHVEQVARSIQKNA